MANHDINLLKKQSTLSGKALQYETVSKKIAWWGLVSLLVAGVILGSTFLYGQMSVTQIQRDIDELRGRLSQQQNKEGLLLALKQRTTVTQRSLESARPWGQLFPLLLKIAQADQYESFQVDILGLVSAQFEFNAIDEAIAVVRQATSLQQEGSIKSTQLTSLNFKQDGTVLMSITFSPTF